MNPSVRYSQPVYEMSVALAQYGAQQWVNQQHVAQIISIQASPSDVLGYLIVFKEPLRDDQITEAMGALHASEFKPVQGANLLDDRRLTWAECWDVLRQWKQKRFGP